jgi:hypothetical protein
VCGGLEDGVGLRASMIGRAVARRSGDASSVRVPYHINAMTKSGMGGAAVEGSRADAEMEEAWRGTGCCCYCRRLALAAGTVGVAA